MYSNVDANINLPYDHEVISHKKCINITAGPGEMLNWSLKMQFFGKSLKKVVNVSVRHSAACKLDTFSIITESRTCN